jgi:hypothetical protein
MEILEEAEWIEKAEIVLREGFIRRTGDPASAPVLEPPLHAHEAEYFVRGLKSGIFSIDDEGYVQSTVLPRSSRDSTRSKILNLFWRHKGDRWSVFREGVCQISTMAVLNLKHGIPLGQIQMEPTFPDLHWPVDILLKNSKGDCAAFCEVKRDDHEMKTFISGFRHCCAAGSHLGKECKFSTNHPKFAACVALKPKHFLAVSPGQEVCFQLAYSEREITIFDVPVSLLVSELQISI